MKKTLIVIMSVMITALYCNAQENVQEGTTDNRDKLHIGIKAGVNLSNVYDAQGEEFKADPKLGFVAGGFLSIPIGIYLGFQPEVLYSQKGFSATYSFLGSTYKFTRTSTYLDIPLLIQLKPSEYLTIMAGPQYSYLMKQEDKFDNITQEQDFDNDNIRKNIFCFQGGVDVNLSQLVLGARVGWDITRNNGDGTSTTPRYKNVWYQATIGFRF